MKSLRFIIFLFVALALAQPLSARRDLNDKVLNRPYADQRRWHLGFSVGAFTQDLRLTHSGLITDDGHQWRIQQPDYQPGFCVNGLLSLRLNDYFSVRFTPGMYFGSHDMRMLDVNSGDEYKQNIKTAYVVMPLDLKFAALRYRNSRPYVVGGVMPIFDVAKKRSDYIKLKAADCFISIGFGCDFYLPYFKLIPEVKFCFSLADVLCKDRPDLADDPAKLQITESVTRAARKMFVLTFYFE